jgi:hypothetical protein
MSRCRQSETDRLFEAIRAWAEHHFPQVGRWRLIGDDPATPGASHTVLLTVPPCRCQQPAGPNDTGEHFTPSDYQLRLLTVLEGRALRTDALAQATREDRTKLFRPGGLKELQEAGLVRHVKEYGYYRPDCPPPELA